jgi:hypothetical protein
MTSMVDSGGGSSVIRSDRRGRMLISAPQREALLDEFDRSGLSAMAFCRMHGLVYPTFAAWVQKRRRLSSTAPAFAEVIVEPCEEARTAVVASPLRITLPSGAILEMTHREQLSLAVELLRQLATPSSC